jgi:hypothetical protein
MIYESWFSLLMIGAGYFLTGTSETFEANLGNIFLAGLGLG